MVPLLAFLLVGAGALMLFLGVAWAYAVGALVFLVVPFVAIALYVVFYPERRTWFRRWWFRVMVGPFSVMAFAGWTLGFIPQDAPPWLRDLARVALHQWHLPGAVPGTWVTVTQHAIGDRPFLAWAYSLEFMAVLVGLELLWGFADQALNAVLGGQGLEPRRFKGDGTPVDPGSAEESVVDDASA